ncbi:unnamed protein product [Litomosoides sigmodontis]|uniref:G-protein coupled receptors family 1 profile domain-containing protein n=1 Tax=Litomosoides sigmodontis TaxID=42156 RepID=A0A3P6V8K9_LITSI|nr:unnamed protein product [Litomosoides sigmodontis]
MFAAYTAKIAAGKYEWSMLIQAAVVCGAMEIETICFYFLLDLAVHLAGRKAEIPVNIFINCYVIMNCAVLPTTSFVLVKRFRDDVKREITDFLRKIQNCIN